MRLLVIKSALLMLFVFTSSCKNQKKEIKEPIKIVKEEVVENNEIKVILDNGKLWKANQETTVGITNMIKLMSSFKDKNKLEAYASLTEKLKNEFTQIFQKCTMKGEAHNQLHNFLIPINTMFSSLDSEDLSICKETFSKLENHLNTYTNYFE